MVNGNKILYNHKNPTSLKTENLHIYYMISKKFKVRESKRYVNQLVRVVFPLII